MEITLTNNQQKAFTRLLTFLDDPKAKVFILKGYAGTGKTTMMRKLIKEMQSRGLPFSLLASTGRASKILANATGANARTVHSEIYNFKDLNQDLEKMTATKDKPLADAKGQLYLDFELAPVEREEDDGAYYYIIDEASMISDTVDTNLMQAKFGSGKLLTDLLAYDKCGKFIFVGDICQLPPISQPVSPALSASYFETHFHLKAYEAELTTIVRQASDNDIVTASQKLRNLYYHPQEWRWAKFPLRGCRDIHILDSQASLISAYIQCAKMYGFTNATMITQSNKQCTTSTQVIRPSFGHLQQKIEKGDLLLVTQNNLISGLMNGDMVMVEDVSMHGRRAGLTFLRVSLKELFTQQVHTQLLIADVVYGNLTNISSDQQKDLLIDFYYRMKDLGIKQKSLQFRQNMMSDPYLNALRAVYGYVLTCHKSQGGEWDYVFLDIPRGLSGQPKPGIYQWVYTAMTRAKKGLYIHEGFWLM